MNITIVGRKCTPREDFRARAEKRLSKVEKLFGEEANAKVTATVEKNCHIVEITVTKGFVFVMGDNRNNSTDSRDEAVGLINTKNILGKAVLRIYPFSEIGAI